MNTLAYLIHFGGFPATGIIQLLINLLVLALVVAVVLWVLGLLGLPQRIQQILVAIIVLICLLSLFVGCATQTPTQKAINAFIAAQAANTDVTGTISGDGVSVTAGRINGRNSVAVGVDAKQVVRAINQ